MRTRFSSMLCGAALLAAAMVAIPAEAPGQLAAGSAFSHQGSLTDGGVAANGAYDFQFRLFRQASGGTPVGTSVTVNAVDVVNGLYAARIDFGEAPFDGEPAFLEIGVRPTGSAASYTLLAPRHELTPTPYALRAGRATTADTAQNAQTADSATTAQSATTATTADSATTATSADSAAEADVAFALDADRVKSSESEDSAGRLQVLGNNNNLNVELTNVEGAANRGRATVNDADGNARLVSEVLSTGVGAVALRGPNGNDNVLLSARQADSNRGTVGVANSTGTVRGELLVSDANDAGRLHLFGPNGTINVALEERFDATNGGWISVNDSGGNPQAAMFVNPSGQGEMFAHVKNFVVDHPERPGHRIVYSSLEGPEVGIYTRGVARLEEGRAHIELPEHFAALAVPGTVTVQLTPASVDSRGVAAVRSGTRTVEIAELGGGEGSYEVHYLVQAERSGFDDYRPVIDREEFRRHYGFDPYTNRASDDETHQVGAQQRPSGEGDR